MTVVTAIITRVCTVHASDSFITVRTGDGQYEVVESEETKIVRVPHFGGIMAYWGLAIRAEPEWNTLDWLSEQSNRANDFGSPEEFAIELKDLLNDEYCRMGSAGNPKSGLGIHFTSLENSFMFSSLSVNVSSSQLL